MRILLAHKFHRLTGGAEVFYFEVGRVLEKNGHEVAYFSTTDENTIKSPYEKYFVKAPNFKSSNTLNQFKAFLKIPYNFDSKKKFRALVNDFKPDLIHAFGVATQISPSIFDVAKKEGIPLVVSLNDYKHICPNYKLFHHNKLCEDCKGGKYYNAVLNKCSHDSLSFSFASAVESYVHSWLNIYRKNIDLFLFASEFMAKKTEEFWGKDSFKWGRLRNPFTISEKPVEEVRENYGLYFGRLSDEKGVELILNALKKKKEIPFRIVGDGPLMNELKRIVAEQNLNNITFLGAMWGEALEDVLYKAKFVVVSSVWHENFPYVILQSLAAGIPVIGSNLGGIPELLSQGRGLLFDVTNNQSLQEAIEKINTDAELRSDVSNKGRLYVEKNFNETCFYEEIMSNYKRLLKFNKKK